jgi:hypothetical protein
VMNDELGIFWKELKLKLNSVALVRKQTTPTERPPLLDKVPTFKDRLCRVVSAADSHGH